MIEIAVADYTQGYIQNRQEKHKESTATEKARTARHFTEWCAEEDIVLDTDQKYEVLDDIRDFFASGRLSLSGPRLYHLRDFLDYIARHLPSTRDQDKLLDIRDNITKDRWPDEAFSTPSKEPEYLTDNEIEQACAVADDHAEAVIRFLFDTGCRLAEMCAVTVADIDFAAEQVGAAVKIDKKRTRKGEIEPPKSDAGYRTVELTDRTATVVQQHIDDHDLGDGDEVFWMTHTTYQRYVKDAFTRIGVHLNNGPDADAYQVAEGRSFVSPHWLRHNRNTRIKQQYGSVAAQQYMGHENEQMTDHYTHYDTEEVQGVVGNKS